MIADTSWVLNDKDRALYGTAVGLGADLFSLSSRISAEHRLLQLLQFLHGIQFQRMIIFLRGTILPERMPKKQDFNKSVLDCSNIIPSNEREDGSNGSGGVRLKPLVYARLSRGGKTTFLIYLFAALRNRGCAPVLITFSGYFTRGVAESQLEALIRLLSAAMMTKINPLDFNSNYSFKGMAALWITSRERLQGNRGEPLDAAVAQFLKRFFLDQKDRYLVFTSHILMDLDDDNSGTYWSTPSPQDYFSVH
eukprot:gene36047-46842_t